MSNPHRLRIEWPDYGIPSLTREQWRGMYDAIIEDGIENVYVHCFGGHGRTGTFISIFAYHAGILPFDTSMNVYQKRTDIPEEEDPVIFIRRLYCEKAVESSKQLDYFEDMTGMLTDADFVSKGYTSSYTGGTTGKATGSTGSSWQGNVYGGVKTPANDYKTVTPDEYDDGEDYKFGNEDAYKVLDDDDYYGGKVLTDDEWDILAEKYGLDVLPPYMKDKG